MDTAGVKVEIVSLCIFTDLLLIDSVLLRLLKKRMVIAFDHIARFFIILTPFESEFKSLSMNITFEGFIQNQGNSQSLC